TNLISSIRGSDTLVRLGGDEFLLELWVKNENDARAAMRSIYTRLNDALQVNGHNLGCSVGALLIPPRGKAVTEGEIGIADQLMYRAKRDRLREPLIALHANGGERVLIEAPAALLTPHRRA